MLSFEYEYVKWGNEFSLPAAGVGTGGGATLFGAGNGLEAEWKKKHQVKRLSSQQKITQHLR